MQHKFRQPFFIYQISLNHFIVNQVSIIPTWGIKRNIGKHFTYETGIGLGYRYYFAKSEGYAKNESSGALNLHLRVGYRF